MPSQVQFGVISQTGYAFHKILAALSVIVFKFDSIRFVITIYVFLKPTVPSVVFLKRKLCYFRVPLKSVWFFAYTLAMELCFIGCIIEKFHEVVI